MTDTGKHHWRQNARKVSPNQSRETVRGQCFRHRKVLKFMKYISLGEWQSSRGRRDRDWCLRVREQVLKVLGQTFKSWKYWVKRSSSWAWDNGAPCKSNIWIRLKECLGHRVRIRLYQSCSLFCRTKGTLSARKVSNLVLSALTSDDLMNLLETNDVRPALKQGLQRNRSETEQLSSGKPHLSCQGFDLRAHGAVLTHPWEVVLTQLAYCLFNLDTNWDGIIRLWWCGEGANCVHDFNFEDEPILSLWLIFKPQSMTVYRINRRLLTGRCKPFREGYDQGMVDRCAASNSSFEPNQYLSTMFCPLDLMTANKHEIYSTGVIPVLERKLPVMLTVNCNQI